jgi:hypothetical protein
LLPPTICGKVIGIVTRFNTEYRLDSTRTERRGEEPLSFLLHTTPRHLFGLGIYSSQDSPKRFMQAKLS